MVRTSVCGSSEGDSWKQTAVSFIKTNDYIMPNMKGVCRTDTIPVFIDMETNTEKQIS